ncbi:MAG: hypothetical protein M0P77_06390 [Firmicutes bacterium]|nr:hypothetical protein [Bacillota bacterium]
MISTIKSILKNTILGRILRYLRYFFSRYFLKWRFSNYKLSENVKISAVDSKGVSFFGYYNLSPENKNGDIIYLKVKDEKVRGSLYEPASIMLKRENGTIIKVAETKAWNWQQGCMLQWMPDNTDRIIFNDYNNSSNSYYSKIMNTGGEIIHQYNKPIYALSKNGKYALTLNFDRLATMRPDYGYFNKKNVVLPSDEQDGIWFIDLETNDIQLIITLEQLKELSWVPTMTNAKHKVNHIDINPSGSRFMFLHRWVGSQGRFMRLITANPDGSDMCILNGDEMTSHSCWLNDEEIISFCKIEDETGYFKLKDYSKESHYFTDLPKTDGHPTLSLSKKFLITDTYPGKIRFSKLIYYDLAHDQLITIGGFNQPLKYSGERRVDLHPKLNLQSNNVFFESAHTGKRKLFKVDIEKIIDFTHGKQYL